ncbi:hypothetical protein [Streptomyces sp. NPDC088766]|uniref:hypothetical protein n=1 Tax=Streptomyces sp. NPDC088766 TaxID=3365893 RepID=UPI003826226C
MRTAGLPHRLVAGCGHDPAGALPEPAARVDAWCADRHDGSGDRWIPLARRVEHRSGVVPAAFEPVARPARAPPRSGEPDWGTGAAVPMHRE